MTIRRLLFSLAILITYTPHVFADDKVQEWVPFDGKATLQGPVYVLKGATGGTIAMDKKHVRISGGKPQIKVGENALIIDSPKASATMAPETVASVRTSTDAAPATLGMCQRQEDCPSGCASCIGLIRVCCGSGGTRGICLGVYGCP